MAGILGLSISYRGSPVDLSCSAPFDEVRVDLSFSRRDIGKTYRLLVYISGEGGYVERIVDASIIPNVAGVYHQVYEGSWRLPPYPGMYRLVAQLIDASTGSAVSEISQTINLMHAIPYDIKWVRYVAPTIVERVRGRIAKAVSDYVNGRASVDEVRRAIDEAFKEMSDLVSKIKSIVARYGTATDAKYLRDIEGLVSEWRSYALGFTSIGVGNWARFVAWLNTMDERFVRPIIEELRELGARLESEWRERVRRREEMERRPPKPVIVSVSAPPRVEPGAPIPLRVVIANEGGGTFRGYLAAKLEQVGIPPSALAVSLGPAEKREVTIYVSAPRKTGVYSVVVELCDEMWRVVDERRVRISVSTAAAKGAWPRVRILWVRSVNPGRPGGRAAVRVCLANDYGVAWSGALMLKRIGAESKIVASAKVVVPPRSTKVVELDFVAPKTPGTHTYLVEAIRSGARRPDDTKEVAIYVPRTPPSTALPAPIAPPSRARAPPTTGRSTTLPAPHPGTEVTKPIAVKTERAKTVAKAMAVAVGLGGALALLIKTARGR